MRSSPSNASVAAPPRTAPRRYPAPDLIDLAGLGLAVALGGWAWLAASRAGAARPLPLAALMGASVVAVAFGRWAGRRVPVLGPSVLAIGIAGLLLHSLPTLPAAAGRPLHYANANATLAGLGVLSALGAVAAGLRRRHSPRQSVDAAPEPRPLALPSLWAVALLLAVLVLVPTSVGSALALLTVVALGGASLWCGTSRVAAAGGAVVVVVMLVATLAIAWGADPVGIGAKTEARGELWAGAVELAQSHPWSGIGPGSFADQNPVTDDRDLRWAHHGYLQVAAELGLPGLTLTLGLLAWAYARLWRAGEPTRGEALRQSPASSPDLRGVGTVAVGAAAVTLVALHATVDYVAHFPAVVLTACLIFGWAIGPADGPRLRRFREQAPAGVASTA